MRAAVRLQASHGCRTLARISNRPLPKSAMDGADDGFSAACVAESVGEADATAELLDLYASISPRPVSCAPPIDTSALNCSLYPHQQQTVSWALTRELQDEDGLSGVRGGVIAEEMGLGKTIEVMALICSHPPSGSHGSGGSRDSHPAGGPRVAASLDGDARCGDGGEGCFGEEGSSSAAAASFEPLEPLASALCGARHPLFIAPLHPSFVGSVSISCSVCQRKLLPAEMVHATSPHLSPLPPAAKRRASPSAGWACCQLCMLSRAPDARERAVRLASEVSAEKTSSGKTKAEKARVRFAEAPSERPAMHGVYGRGAANGAGTASSGGSGGSSSSSSGSSGSSSSSVTGLKIRIKRPRPRWEVEQEELARQVAAVLQPAAPPPPPRTCGCTLLVAPPTLLRQWLEELKRHAPMLAARTLVYTGLRDLGERWCRGAAHEALLGAFERAWLVLTTFSVLQQEVWYGGEGESRSVSEAAAARRRPGGSRERLRTPLRQRTFWRLVIDEAQSAQSRSTSASLLAKMCASIRARHRWCVTGTPLSPERGIADAFDVLGSLGCSHELARDRTAFRRALTHTHGREALLRVLRALMWRTSKAMVASEASLTPILTICHTPPCFPTITRHLFHRSWRSPRRSSGCSVCKRRPPKWSGQGGMRARAASPRLRCRRCPQGPRRGEGGAAGGVHSHHWLRMRAHRVRASNETLRARNGLKPTATTRRKRPTATTRRTPLPDRQHRQLRLSSSVR